MDISSLLNDFNHDENIYYNDNHEVYIPVKIPKHYRKVPEFELDLEKHEKCDFSFIKKYFNNLVENNYEDVSVINGVETGLYDVKSINKANYCDICTETIRDIKWYCERPYEGYDYEYGEVCLKCKSKSESDCLVLSNKQSHTVSDFDFFGFGSIFDWIPIIKDNEYNMILLNCNPDSKQYGKVGLVSCDDHGRFGYEYVDEKLEDVLIKLKGYKNKFEGDNSWNEFYDYPIKQYMCENNMQIHYG